MSGPRDLDVRRVAKIADAIEEEEARYLGYRETGEPQEFNSFAYWQDWRSKVDEMYRELSKALDIAAADRHPDIRIS